MYHNVSTKKKVSQTNKFVKSCIVTALFDLLEKENIDKITITDIINRAGVSRMGFYRNYRSKAEVIEKYVYDSFIETISQISSYRPLNFNTKNILLTTLENFAKHSHYMKILLDQNLDFLMYNCYLKSFRSLYIRKNTTRVREYWLNMFMGELFNLETTWLKQGMVETPEEMVEIYNKILKLKYDNIDKTNVIYEITM